MATMHWFRKGLRLADNPALLAALTPNLSAASSASSSSSSASASASAAAPAGAFYPVFILDPWFANPARLCANRYNYLLECLADLDASLRALGSRLLVVRGAPADVLPELLAAWGVTLLTYEADTEPYALARDARVEALCAARGVATRAVPGHTLYAPAELLARAGAGGAPASYEAFLKLLARLPQPPPPYPPPAALPPAAAWRLAPDAHALPSLAAAGYRAEDVTSAFRGSGGERAAAARLAACMARTAWVAGFSKPATNPTALAADTTALSPALKFGALGARTFYHALLAVPGRTTAPPVSLTGQLLWREFFYLHSFATPNYDRMAGNPACRQIAWGYDAGAIAAWEAGRTGYPWIDACMTQLRVDGWLHHLGRHAVACFLTRGDLWQSWEHGARVFDKYLLDGDWALNNGNWQWLSCSNFYYQYFKCYSPVAFAKKYDKEGAYIRKWLPAFRTLPAKYVYEPWLAPLEVQRAHGVVVGPGGTYPARIVLHEGASKANMERMAAAYEAHKAGGGAAAAQTGGAALLAKGVGGSQLLALAGAAAVLGDTQTFWWYYQGYDAENEDIRQLPCKADCTIAELETACAADATCVAFNTHGFLKKSIADMAPDSCDLYVKKDTPQPSPTPAPPPPAIPFWPLPVSLKTGATALPVSKGLAFTITGAPNPDLAAYAARTAALMFQHSAPAPAGAALAAVTITVADPGAPLALGVDESYNLTIPSDGSPATLLAATNYGAYWGLQTLAQAVRFDFDARAYVVPATPIVIADAPKFAWRGILIDTDRHWLSLPTIFAIIDSLTYAKMNIIHWHIVDWQSWPLESVAVPNLWNRSWSARERYTLADIATVVEYARARGVRTVPEFDTPGHASSMCFQYPELCPSAACSFQTNNPLTPVPDASGKPVALNAIQAVLGEIAAQSPDEFFHLGGDEVDQSCWANTPAVQAWMKAQGINSTDGVYEYFVEKVDAMTLALGKSPIRWEEVWKHFGTDLDQRTVIHAWLSSGALIDATSKGYRAIWSVDGLYYLDALNEVWQSFYNVDILAGITNTSAIPLVLGGETEMWGETADGSDVLQTIWPRAAAAAERQWSYDVTSKADAGVAYRLQAFRCWLLERGVAAAPVTNPSARSAPAGPGSCMMQ